jgi:IS30 family transposase
MDERERIAQYLATGLSVTSAAALIGRSPSTLYRELARNGAPGHYSPSRAESAYHARRESSRRPWRLEGDSDVRADVADGLRATWSPEQIAERLAAEHPRAPERRVGVATIYRWLARDRAQGGRLYLHLRRRGRRYLKRYGKARKCGPVADRRPMDQRPVAADRRERLGDFEGDTVCAGRAAAMATLVDRKSRFLVAAPLADGRARTMRRAVVRALGEIPMTKRRTLTLDNGHEFAEHRKMEAALGIKAYFAPPYQSWRRGTNENTNGLLREFFPKRERRKPTRKQVDRAVDLLNNRPRKCLGWRTPAEVFLFKSRFCLQFH